MIKNNQGDYHIEGDAFDLFCEFQQITMTMKEMFKDDEDILSVFERDLLLLFLARDEKDFWGNPVLTDRNKVRLLKKVAKYIKEEEETEDEEGG